MPAQREMPRYKCHKEVWALKIRAVEGEGDPVNGAVYRLVFEDDGYAPIPVSPEYMQRHKPQAGGYYVQYQDGYTSYSPAQAFEEGYTRI